MRFTNGLILGLLCIVSIVSCNEGDPASADFQAGQGGSMTRFAFHDDFLYVLSSTSINVYDISNNSFTQVNTVTVGRTMETIFANDEFLYMGATDAMYIYSLTSPSSPEFVFRYQHITSCDPVVVQGDIAYVTMRSGTACNAGSNALEILDISDPYNPQLLANHPMDSPHGLGVSGDLLFLCEGASGLKLFRLLNNGEIELIEQRSDFEAYDVIVRPNHAIVTGDDGIFQFTFDSDGSSLELLSSIPVNRSEL
jgi:hypothetical protein